MDTSHIDRAVKIVGSQAELGRVLGITAGAVHQWVAGLRPVPARFAIAIERATDGAVASSDLRPDIFGDPPEAAAKVITPKPKPPKTGGAKARVPEKEAA